MLKIERLPSYLSPSALSTAEKMPNTFYLSRLISDPLKREAQGLAAAVGSAFDYYIKMKLIAKKFQHKTDKLPEIKTGIETYIDEAFRAGKRAFRSYVDTAYCEEIYADVELWLNGLLEGVPLFGKLDATVFDEGKVIPFDWKVTGYTSNTATSPAAGYYRLWEGVFPKAKHDLYESDIPFEIINEGWATQLCTYGWLMDKPYGTPFHAKVDVLVWKNGSIRCIAQYKGLITENWQKLVLYRYKRMWDLLNSGEFIKLLDSTKDENLVWIASKSERWY